MVGVPNYYGRVFGSYIKNLSVDQRARIDLIHYGKCVYTSGSIINIPGEASNNIHVRNDGPCNIQYSINGADINDMVGGILAPTIARELKWPDTIVKSVNILCLATSNNLFANASIEILK